MKLSTLKALVDDAYEECRDPEDTVVVFSDFDAHEQHFPDIEGAGLPAALATGAVAAAQAPTGHHYLLDVVVGGAVGWASEAVVSAVFDRLEPAVRGTLNAEH